MANATLVTTPHQNLLLIVEAHRTAIRSSTYVFDVIGTNYVAVVLRALELFSIPLRTMCCTVLI